MATPKKKPTFAELCVTDHKKVIAAAIRKIAKENEWGCVALAEQTKASTATCSYLLRGDNHSITLDKMCVMAYELGIHIGMTIVNPNA